MTKNLLNAGKTRFEIIKKYDLNQLACLLSSIQQDGYNYAVSDDTMASQFGCYCAPDWVEWLGGKPKGYEMLM